MRESILGIFVIFLWTVITKKSIVNLTDDFHEIFIHYRLENTLSIKNIALSFFIFFVSIGSFFLLFEFFKRTWFGNGYSSDTIFVYIKLPISSYSTEILTLFSSFIIAPILEEVFFRGLLLHATETAKWSKKSLYLFQVVIFGIVHIPNHLELSMFYFIIYMTNICLLGFYFTWIMRKTRNLLYPIVAHCLWNIQVDGLNFFYNLGYIDITNTMYNFLIIIGIISLFLIIMYYIIKIINGLIILIKLEE